MSKKTRLTRKYQPHSNNFLPSINEKGNASVLEDVSDNSRFQGRAPIEIQIEKRGTDIESIWDELIEEKKQIEAELSNYNQTAFSMKQSEVRNKYRGCDQTTSIEAWIEVKAKMEKERKVLVNRKVTIEREMIRIKPKLKESRRLSDIQYSELLKSVVFELREIKEILLRKANITGKK